MRPVLQSFLPALLASVFSAASFASPAPSASSQASHFTTDALDKVQAEINLVENELLQSREKNTSAASQLQKIKKLLTLQKKEISLSEKRIQTLDDGFKSLDLQKTGLEKSLSDQKRKVKVRLKELERLSQTTPMDAVWFFDLDASSQRSKMLSGILKKDFVEIATLKKDSTAFLSLENRILEEKNKLDFYVHELKDQVAILSANRTMQQEIIQQNRANRLELFRKVKDLKDAEKKVARLFVEKTLEKNLETNSQEQIKQGLSAIAQGPVSDLLQLKGKLPFPVTGQLVGVFGRSYNAKTNLLTFQKGISIAPTASSAVRCVSEGKTVYAGPLKNYGMIVIVEHPGNYYSLYGQLGEIKVKEGSAIERQSVIGTTGKEPFYFEIRNKNIAVNPLQWLKDGARAVALSKRG